MNYKIVQKFIKDFISKNGCNPTWNDLMEYSRAHIADAVYSNREAKRNEI